MRMSYLFLACFFWALDTLIRYPLLGRGVSVQLIVFLEHSILCLLFLPSIIKGFPKFKKEYFLPITLVGGLGSCLSTYFFTKAMTIINPSVVILLQKLQPLVAIGLSATILKEKITSYYILFFAVALLGAFLLGNHEIFALKNWTFEWNLHSMKGFLYAFLAVGGWGASTVFGKQLLNQGMQPKEVLSWRYLVGFVFASGLLLSSPPQQSMALTWTELFLSLLAMVTLSGIIGTQLYYKGLVNVPAKIATLVELSFPFFAVVINWIFLGAKLGPMQIFGGVLLSASPSLIEYIDHKKNIR